MIPHLWDAGTLAIDYYTYHKYYLVYFLYVVQPRAALNLPMPVPACPRCVL